MRLLQVCPALHMFGCSRLQACINHSQLEKACAHGLDDACCFRVQQLAPVTDACRSAVLLLSAVKHAYISIMVLKKDPSCTMQYIPAEGFVHCSGQFSYSFGKLQSHMRSISLDSLLLFSQQ